MSVYGWQRKREQEVAEQQADLEQAAAQEKPEGACPKCGQPMTNISTKKRKCKPCGHIERDE